MADVFDLIPPQHAYLAQRCPVAAQLAFDSSLEVLPAATTEAERARIDAGTEFERRMFESIATIHGDAVVVVEMNDTRDRLQAATVSAMVSGASIVLGGWLPDDVEARRTGRPDILLRFDSGWLPIDVKHHGAVIASDLGSERRTGLSDLWPDKAQVMPGVALSERARSDSLQLAHYWRLLEACGLAANAPVGGIVASDGYVWWIDLAEPRWKRRSLSALDLYDREFQLRLGVISRQLERNDDPNVNPLVIPLRKTECKSCKWQQVCGEELAEGDSVSLLPGVSWPNALRLIQQGVKTRKDLARLDWNTAWLMHGDVSGSTHVDVVEILKASEQANPSTELSHFLGRQKKVRLDRLAALNMTAVGDLVQLDGHTGALSRVKVGYLPGLIDQSRAAVAGQAFLARGKDAIEVPRADVEVDVDMESCEGRVYLWGTWTRRDASTSGNAGYRPFFSWAPLDSDLEVEVFSQFWDWLLQTRNSTVESGGTFAAYCYSSAENTQMRRIVDQSASGPNRNDVEEFIASSEWVDLHAVVKDQVVTGAGFGLKEIAPIAGFHWRDEDPGGDQSTVWYERAVRDRKSVV